MSVARAIWSGTDAAWEAAWNELGLVPPSGLRERLAAAYDEPTRAYHNRRHLNEGFAHLATVADRLDRPGEVVLALWWHDAVYDPQRPDNEAASAEWAERSLTEADVDPAVVGSIHALILATRHDAPPPNSDAAYLVDADLAILGADPARFAEYEDQVRREYAWVDEAAFAAGRADILRRFAARPRIFATPEFRDRLEAAARANLARAIEHWAKSSGGENLIRCLP